MAGVRVALAVEMEVPEGSEEAVKGVEMVVDERAVAKAEAAKEAGLEGAGMAAAMEVATVAEEMVTVAEEMAEEMVTVAEEMAAMVAVAYWM